MRLLRRRNIGEPEPMRDDRLSLPPGGGAQETPYPGFGDTATGLREYTKEGLSYAAPKR